MRSRFDEQLELLNKKMIAMGALRRKSDEFEQIVSSMSEGLVLLDEHGMVLSMNTAAKKIFAVKKEIKGNDFLLVDRTSKMSKAIWNALEGSHSEYTEERHGSEYQFTINPIVSDDKVLGAVILVFDISDRALPNATVGSSQQT